MRTDARLEDLLRRLAPEVLGALVRRYGHFDACEDAVQEALLAAATRWPVDGLPERPRAWLTTVAARRVTDELRASSSRRDREHPHLRLGLRALRSALIAPSFRADRTERS